MNSGTICLKSILKLPDTINNSHAMCQGIKVMKIKIEDYAMDSASFLDFSLKGRFLVRKA
jgi:hypothetical protein